MKSMVEAGIDLKFYNPLQLFNLRKYNTRDHRKIMVIDGKKSKRDEIIFDISGCVRIPTIRKGDYKLMGKELYNIVKDPSEKNDIAKDHPDIVKKLKARLDEVAKERPPMPSMKLLMSPAQPWVYGEAENKNCPEWVKEIVNEVRKTQPKSWAPGKTPWPQAPKDGKIIYTGDGR